MSYKNPDRLYDDIVSHTNLSWVSQPIEPFWAIKEQDEESILDWMSRFFQTTELSSLLRTEKQLLNRFRARGVYWEGQDPYGFFTNNVNTKVDDGTRINVPDEHKYIQNFSTRLLRYKAETLPTPSTNEFEDKQLTRVAKMALTSIKQQFDFEKIDRSMARRLPTDGESFLLVTWDKDAGPYSERYLKAKKKYEDKKVKFTNGWIYDPKEPERIGDFCFKIAKLNSLRFDPDGTCPENTQYFAHVEFKHIEQIICDYPDAEAEIRDVAKSESLYNIKDIDIASGVQRVSDDRLPVITFYHRKHKRLPFGKHIVLIPGQILHNEENPFCELEALEDCPWGELPLESMIDLPIEDHLHGYPSLNIFSSFTRARNQILSSAHASNLLYNAPKIAIPEGANVDINALIGGGVAFTYSGDELPTLLSFNAISKESISFYELLGEEWSKASNMHPISQGNPPNGVTAGVALRLLQEIEDKLFEEQIKMQNRYVVSRDTRILAMMGKYYSKDDKRFIRIVGEDNADIIEELDTRMLGVRFNVRLEQANPGAFSAAARKQDVIDLLQYGPENVLAPEQILDALQLNRPEKITDPAQTAVANAERVVEMAQRGEKIPMPREGENYMTKWKVFMSFYQRPGFTELPEKTQKEFIDMVTALEFLMDEQALKNPVYGQVLLSQPQWPAFYTPSPRPIPMEQQVQNTANQMAMEQMQSQQQTQPLQG